MQSLVIYVDVEGTLINSFGNKTIPIESVVKHIRELYEHGAILYCWSSAGADFAKEAANKVGLEECFQSFLPKPNVLIDDISIENWSKLLQIHPSNCVNKTLYDYEDELV